MLNRVVDVLIPKLTPTFATGVLTSNNTNVSDNDTVTIGTVVYRFKTTIAQIGDINIGANADASLTNLANAINGAGTPGTDYFTGTPKDLNVSSSAVASHALTLTALQSGSAKNTIATTKSAATLTWGDTTLDGGGGGDMTAIHFDGSAIINSLPIDVQAYIEAIAYVNVTAHAGTTPMLDVKIQYSPDYTPGTNNGTWIDSGDAFTQITTVNGLFLKKLTANFGRWIRLVFTPGGTLPDYTLSAYVLAKL